MPLQLSEKSIAIMDVMRQHRGGIQVNISSKKFSISGGPGYRINASGWPADKVVYEYALNLIAHAKWLREDGQRQDDILIWDTIEKDIKEII
jgi:hypothetical protein